MLIQEIRRHLVSIDALDRANEKLGVADDIEELLADIKRYLGRSNAGV